MKKRTEITIRSSAAKYLTYVAATGDSQESIEMRYENENIWLTQKLMAQLYDISVHAVGQHIKRIYGLAQLERIVTAYLDIAELQAIRHIPMTMQDWEECLNGFLRLMDHDILIDTGKVCAELAKAHAESEFEKYRVVQNRLYESDFDRFMALENEVNCLQKKAGEERKSPHPPLLYSTPHPAMTGFLPASSAVLSFPASLHRSAARNKAIHSQVPTDTLPQDSQNRMRSTRSLILLDWMGLVSNR